MTLLQAPAPGSGLPPSTRPLPQAAIQQSMLDTQQHAFVQCSTPTPCRPCSSFVQHPHTAATTHQQQSCPITHTISLQTCHNSQLSPLQHAIPMQAAWGARMARPLPHSSSPLALLACTEGLQAMITASTALTFSTATCHLHATVWAATPVGL